MSVRKRIGFLLFIAFIILFSATSLAEYEQYRLPEPYELYTGPYTTVYPLDSHNVIVSINENGKRKTEIKSEGQTK